MILVENENIWDELWFTCSGTANGEGNERYNSGQANSGFGSMNSEIYGKGYGNACGEGGYLKNYTLNFEEQLKIYSIRTSQEVFITLY